MASDKPTHVSLDEKTVDQLSWTQRIAAFELRKNLAECQKEMEPLGDAGVNVLAPIRNSLWVDGSEDDKVYHVGIIGAGVAGLFTAMLFDYMKKHFGLKVEYEILEANGEDRIGGRLFTKQLGKKLHEYYDVGAMRFPKNDIMKRTYALFEVLDMKYKEDAKEAERGDLIKYYMLGKKTPTRYNDITVVKDPRMVTASDFAITDLPESIMNVSPGKKIDEAIEKLVKYYHDNNPEMFWEYLMDKYDRYSVRQFLSNAPEGPKMEYNEVEWLETASYGNRWYDQAFSEMVLETLDFETKTPNDFTCVMGGAQEIAKRMADKLQQPNKIRCGKTVDQMDFNRDEEGNPLTVRVGVRGESSPRTYDAVFNSAPLGAMQHMRLEGLRLNWGTKQAIRNLGYGPSAKIGVQFKEMWWRDPPYNITQGGVAKTDLPIRCCVYPSYNLEDSPRSSGVLLVSYTWSAEAEKLGALMSRNSPKDEEQLMEVVLHDLARLHTRGDDQYKELLAKLRRLYVTHYAHNWYSDPHQVGAFAYFGPGQYSHMYKHITRNDGKHIIIGEAASAHHAWVVGALESAVRGVYQFAYRHSEHNSHARDIVNAYADPKHEKRPSAPFGPLPAEFDRTAECAFMEEKDIEEANGESKSKLKDLLSNIGKGKAGFSYGPNGDLCRQGVLVEMIRQRQGGELLDGKSVAPDEVTPFLEAVAAIKAVAAVKVAA